MTYVPGHVTETQFPTPWTTCNPAAATMGTAKATRGMIPATVGELRRLWDTLGKLPGYNAGQVMAGQETLYGTKPSWAKSQDLLIKRLSNDQHGVVFYGSYPKLPWAIRSRSRQPGYTGLHAVYGQASAGGVTIGDPLATAGFVTVALGSLLAFAGSLGYEHLTYVEGAWNVFKPRDPVIIQEWDTVPGARFIRPDGSIGTFKLSVPVTTIAEGTVTNENYRLLDYGPDHEALLMARSGLTNPRNRHVGLVTKTVQVQPTAEQIKAAALNLIQQLITNA